MDGTKFGRYQLLQRIAIGGMAEIFLAKQLGPGHFERSLVIKRILPHLAEDPKFVEMFLDEAALAAQLNHPNIAQVYDFGAEGTSYFIAMELIRGPDLANMLEACRTLAATPPIEIALRIITQVASALDYAHHALDDRGHELGLVHRDVSPQNVLVSYDGVVKLVDFGIAKAAGASHKTETGLVKGKFSYMAPEQLRGEKLDGRTDQYATGLLLYELLTLTKALPGDGPGSIAAALEARIAPIESLRPALPVELSGIVHRALRLNRAERFRDCRELQETLDRWLMSKGIAVRPHEIATFLAGLQEGLGKPLSPVPSSTPKAQPKPAEPLPQTLVTPPPARSLGQSEPRTISATALTPSASRAVMAPTELEPAPSAPVTSPPPKARARFPWAVAIAVALATVAAGAWFLSRRGPQPPPSAVAVATQPSTPTPTPTAAPTATATLTATPTPPPKPAVPTAPPRSAPAPTATRTHPTHPTHLEPHPARPERSRVASSSPPRAQEGGPATLSISSDPPTEAFLDGADLGQTPVASRTVSAGKHTLRLANADLGISHVSHLALAPGESHDENVRLGKGKVVFIVKPWANITFAGQPLGQTPIPPHTAYEGTYDVVVDNPTLRKTIRQKVTVQSGQPTLLKIDLTQGGG